jgi:glyoxylase-like metal-dependent hydrolase (beta-lactamase superfamily II)
MSDQRKDLPICVTCGVQHGPDAAAPDRCRICDDERQYIGWDGQRWTTLDELRRDHSNRIEEEGPGLTGFGTRPAFGIGQRALLLETGNGNVLWDCISLVDDDTIAAVEARGGLAAIAVSHPHFYGAMVDWSRAFGGVPVYVHEADREWVMRPDDCIEFWSGERTEIGPGLTLLNGAVHFAGGAVLHSAAHDGGAGAILSGDIFQVVMDRRWVSFMRSYPNLIPERPDTIRRAIELTEPYRFERIYGAFWKRNVEADAKAALNRSAQRYLRQVEGQPG